MVRPGKLNQEEIESELLDLPLWNLSGSTIIREIVTKNFASAVGVVNTIAVIAEKMDHHPDILLYGWNKLRITTSTHDKDGLTELDFKLAKKIEELHL